MFRFASRAETPVSDIRKIFQQLPEVNAKRISEGLSPLINLSIGQPHLPANPEVMKKIEETKYSQSSQGYSSAQGEPATLEAIVKLYNHYYPEIGYSTKETMVTIGGSGALSNIFSILVESKEDIILAFEPYFGAYTGQIQQWGGTLKKIPTLKDNLRPTAEGLEEALKTYPTTKALIMNYPNNPSGVALTKNEVMDIAKLLEKYPNIIIIIDDVYRDFNYTEHHTVLDVSPHLKDRCVVINSGAKGLLGAPGERIGMVAAHEELIKSMSAIQTNSLSSVPYRTQAALRYAVDNYLQNPKNDWLMNTRNEYKTNIETASIGFIKLGFTLLQQTDGAFYLLVCAKHLMGKINSTTLEEIKSDVDIANYFLHSAGVATVPGSGFGIESTEGYLRISCANDKKLLLEAIHRLDQAIQLLIKPESQSKNTHSNLIQFSILSQNNSPIIMGEDNNTLVKKNNYFQSNV